MMQKLLRPRLWLVLGWRALARLLRRTPQAHPARPYLLLAVRAAEARYWRQAHGGRRTG